MIKRLLWNKLTGLLKQFPAVAIPGARQVGKTTLAKQLVAVKKEKTLYLDLEKPADRNRLL